MNYIQVFGSTKIFALFFTSHAEQFYFKCCTYVFERRITPPTFPLLYSNLRQWYGMVYSTVIATYMSYRYIHTCTQNKHMYA